MRRLSSAAVALERLRESDANWEGGRGDGVGEGAAVGWAMGGSIEDVDTGGQLELLTRVCGSDTYIYMHMYMCISIFI